MCECVFIEIIFRYKVVALCSDADENKATGLFSKITQIRTLCKLDSLFLTENFVFCLSKTEIFPKREFNDALSHFQRWKDTHNKFGCFMNYDFKTAVTIIPALQRVRSPLPLLVRSLTSYGEAGDDDDDDDEM